MRMEGIWKMLDEKSSNLEKLEDNIEMVIKMSEATTLNDA